MGTLPSILLATDFRLSSQAAAALPKITLRPNGPVRMALRLVDRGQAIQRPNERIPLTGPAFRSSTAS